MSHRLPKSFRSAVFVAIFAVFAALLVAITPSTSPARADVTVSPWSGTMSLEYDQYYAQNREVDTTNVGFTISFLNDAAYASSDDTPYYGSSQPWHIEQASAESNDTSQGVDPSGNPCTATATSSGQNFRRSAIAVFGTDVNLDVSYPDRTFTPVFPGIDFDRTETDSGCGSPTTVTNQVSTFAGNDGCDNPITVENYIHFSGSCVTHDESNGVTVTLKWDLTLDPTLDTDRDGFTDVQELSATPPTNPIDAASYPGAPPPQAPGTINVSLTTDPSDSSQGFSVGGPVVATLVNSDSSNVSVAAGTYNETIDLPSGWQILRIDCSGGSGNFTTGILTFVVTPDSYGTCTYHLVNPVLAYAPILALYPSEKYLPDSAGDFIAHSRLMYYKGVLTPNLARKIDGSCKAKVLVDTGHIDINGLGQYKPQGTYKTDSVAVTRTLSKGAETFTCANRRVIKDNASTAANPNEVKANADERLVGTPSNVHQGFYLDLNNSYYGGNLSRAHVYYQYVPHNYVAYWFFYDFNGWEANGITERHEGDWEHIVVKLGSNSQLTHVDYYEHNCGAWGTKKFTKTTSVAQVLQMVAQGASKSIRSTTPFLVDSHPVVFSAQGGHASYPGVGTQMSSDCGLQGHGDKTSANGVFFQTEARLANANIQPWYGFGGSWGDTRKSNISGFGPLGPGPGKNPLRHG